jgi:hypothetical protein
MLTSSAKAKGRRACKRLKEELLKKFPELEPNDIKVTPSGVTGEDLLLSPKAERVFSYVLEVKCQERLNVFRALEQALSHVEGGSGRKPLLVFTRNREELYVALKLKDFLQELKK